MQVHELIEKLSICDPNEEVYVFTMHGDLNIDMIARPTSSDKVCLFCTTHLNFRSKLSSD